MIIDDVIELVLDLIFDVSVELIPNKSFPKCLRYLLTIFVILVFAAVDFGIILLGFILLIGGIFRIRKYLNNN